MLFAAVVLLVTLQQAPYTEVYEVRRHNVDVIVTDKQGHHVGGLVAGDFEVFEDGKLQEVTNFAEFADPTVKRVSATPGQAAPAAQAPPPRKFVIFVDEMTMHPATRHKFARSVSELMEHTMGPEDEAVVLRPTDPGKVMVSFTRDHDALRADVAAAMESTRFRFNSPLELENRLSRIDIEMAGGSTREALRDAARRQAARVRERVEHRLGNLRGVVSALAAEPGRKVIIVVSESLPAEPGRETFRTVAAAMQDVPNIRPAELNGEDMLAMVPKKTDYVDERPVIEEIARSASANGITIYFIQPTQIELSAAPGGADSRESNLDRMPRLSMAKFDLMDNHEETMNILTGKTGGKWYRGHYKVDDAFRQVAEDVTAYYSMAYRAEGGLDRPHKVTVRVKNRPDLQVRARNEVVRRSITNEVTDRVVASLVRSDSENELGIATRPGAIERNRRAATANIDVLIPLSHLTFVEENGKRRASFTIHYAVTGERQDFVSGVTPEQIVEIPDAEFAAAQDKNWRYTLTLNIRRAPHRVGIGVLDPLSQQYGISTVELDTR